MASFCIEQKEEVMMQPIKNGCCRRSLLYGILASRGIASGGEVTLRLDNEKIAIAVSALVFEFFGKECVSLPKKQGERSVSISFSSPSATRFITELEKTQIMAPIPKCSACASAFLQGIFVAIGRVSSPDKQYCLELSPENKETPLNNYLLDIGVQMRSSLRMGKPILYLRSSGEIEDFFATAQMNATAFRFMNAKIESDIRNTANRVANCETGNIAKAVDASARQIEAIEWLSQRGLLSSLPEELEKTARLRLLHRDLSLSQLAALSVPPITKPGLSHRLNRIVSIAGRLVADEK